MATLTTPTGAQCVMDGATPRTFTAKAMSVISGGEFVFVSGVAADYHSVGSLVAQYDWNDIQVTPVVNGGAVGTQSGTYQFNGINLRNVGSGGKATVATRGVYLSMCGGSVLPGMKVECLTNHTIQTLGSTTIPSALHAAVNAGKPIGRALTMGYSGTSPGSTYALFDLQA